MTTEPTTEPTIDPTGTTSAPTIAPPFDPELAGALEAILEFLPRMSDEALPALRAFSTDGMPGVEPFDLTAGGAVTVQELSVPGPEGAPDLTLLVLKPSTGTGPWPCIYATHGGGMIMGDRRMEVPNFLPVVAEGLAVLVSVEYRLAPEHPDPAPIEDCYAGLVWVARNAASLSIDPDRLLVGGTSAGGGLAAGLALMARDRGFPTVTHQILTCPMLDDRFETRSSRMLDGQGVWDRNDNTYGWTALLGDRRGGSDVSIYAAPARATDLSGLPTTYLDCGSSETFRDEILDYAGRLSEAGVTVDLHMWGGAFHGFDAMAPYAGISQASQAVRQEFIRRALAG
ncbi:acetyl esterase/lipase [Kineosphaera limosa]|uniref:Heroin esterase n=1 Tax=Kineosphaera limosa NBRC 100340 TaxID=1184609 RepID=K6X883_9MICO|nr:alpha/beta hydrolase [Kineosphaera limosa]NYE00500.1 acetyl esterase/lipase [Kineosphaera limosa]GAB95034.1 heroin esterase [Kineosphaera limosa NBRC 100340]